MATNNPFGFDTTRRSYYDVLKIPRSATSEDIQRAFKRQARLFHPDKSGEQHTGTFQQLVRARDTLLNKVKRERYDENHEDNEVSEVAGALTCGQRLSDTYKQLFSNFEREFIYVSRETLHKFPEEFQEMLTKFSTGFLYQQCVKADPTGTRQIFLPTSSEITPLDETVSIVSSAASEQEASCTNQHQALAKVYKNAIARGHYSNNHRGMAPIVDFSSSPRTDLQVLLEHLSSEEQDTFNEMTTAQLHDQILKYVPCQLPQYLINASGRSSTTSACGQCQSKFWLYMAFFKKPQQCVACTQIFCIRCLISSVRLYGYGTTGAQNICNLCLERFYQQHSTEWVNRALIFIQAGSLQDVKAAFGCIEIALSLNKGVSLNSFSKHLLQHNLPELALPLVLSFYEQSSECIDKVKANRLLSSVFNAFANKYSDVHIRRYLLLAAKETAIKAKSEAENLSSAVAVSDLPSFQTAVDKIVTQLQRETRTHDEQQCVTQKLLELERLWEIRNLEAMIDVLKAPDDEHNTTLQALEWFLCQRDKFLFQMQSDDHHSLLFFRGVLNLYQKRIEEGISNIEQVAWHAHSVDVLRKEAIQILLTLVRHDPSVFRLDGLRKVLPEKLPMLLPQKNTYNAFCLREHQLTILDSSNISPPFKCNWPELSVVGLNLRAHRKCEAAFSKQLQDKKWGYQDVGFAYIDCVQGCRHPAECAISLLHASMWFLKDLQETRMTSSKRFALKKIILALLGEVYMIAQQCFHPGMQVYVGRIGLTVAFETIKTAESEAVPEDKGIVSALLHMVTYNSRFTPFWNFPTVSVAEAALMSIISAELHSQYLDQLSQTNPSQTPMTKGELQYQLYENDLRGVHDAEDSKATHLRAMNELLLEKGWTMSDVARLMTSPLSPRDGEGWLIQQPQLGTQQEFAEIKGIILDIDSSNPSIQLVVVPANDSRGRTGTCSKADFQHVLSMLDQTGALFFSLEQPDVQKRFHPFQEFRYSSEDLYKSSLLHTLFETDYLMKSFSVGTEVSAYPPFDQRPTKEGLTKNLPQRLQERLKPVSDRGAMQNRANRFWIQADEIQYTMEQSNSRIEIRLGEPKMIIRSHLLIPGKDGKLKDTKQDEDPSSPEAKFAADMTEVYDELGLHFPMFARLKQLAKLHILGRFLHGILETLKEKAKSIPIEIINSIKRDASQHIKEEVDRNLDSVSSSIGVWPEAEDRGKVREALRRFLRESNVLQEMNVPDNDEVYSLLSPYIEPRVIEALESKDESVLTQVVDGFMTSTDNKLSRYTLTTHVRAWLQNRSSYNQRELVSFISSALVPSNEVIKSQIEPLYKKQYTTFCNFVKQLGVPNPNSTIPNKCKWVPAALRREQDGDHLSLCYGGVLIAPEVTDAWVPTFPHHSRSVPIQQKAPDMRTRRGRYQSSSQSKATSTPHFAPQSHPLRHTSVPLAGTQKIWSFARWNQVHTYQLQGARAFRLYSAAGGSGSGSGSANSTGASGATGGDGSNSSHRTLLVLTAVSVATRGVKKLIQAFRDKHLSAETALEEVAKTPYKNPLCKRRNCVACVDRIPPVTSFTTSSGITYKTTSIPMNVKNAIYMIQCKVTGKMYIGMTTREAIERIVEHLLSVVKKKGKTVARHFNDLSCFGQFEEYMNISPIAHVSEDTTRSYTPEKVRKTMEYIEAVLIDHVGPKELMNKKIPSTDLPPGVDANIVKIIQDKLSGKWKMIVDGKVFLEESA